MTTMSVFDFLLKENRLNYKRAFVTHEVGYIIERGAYRYEES